MREFIPQATLANAVKCAPDACAVAISGRNVLVKECGNKITLPSIQDIPQEALDTDNSLILGDLAGRQCAGFIFNGECSGNLKMLEMRTAFTRVSAGACYAICRAKSLLEWKKRRNYCGVCAAKLQPSENDIALKCSPCGEPYYPQLAPAVIVAITKEDKILLAHNGRFPERVHSLIAGFVEAGESIEQAVAREIFEETSIEISDLRYAASQSWPFPNSLMLGFTAEYDSGEVTPDGDEIVDAGFYPPDALPPLPGHGSIARRIIDEYIAEAKK
jgi:NAD+ diphosphatase